MKIAVGEGWSESGEAWSKYAIYNIEFRNLEKKFDVDFQSFNYLDQSLDVS